MQNMQVLQQEFLDNSDAAFKIITPGVRRRHL